MRRRLFLPIAVVCAALAIVAVVAAIRGYTAQGRVYSLAQVQDGLVHQPRAWLGRTVLVRAELLSIPVPVSSASADPSHLVMGYPLLPATDTGALPPAPSPQVPQPGDPALGSDIAARDRMLVLVHGDEPPMLRSLRHAPLIGGLVQQPQVLDFFHNATYQVRLQAAPATSMACLTGPCYEAVLLDAAAWPSLRYTNFLH